MRTEAHILLHQQFLENVVQEFVLFAICNKILNGQET
jgi:hypothetical protein